MENANKRRKRKLESGPQEIKLLVNSPTFYIFSDLEWTRQSLKQRKFILKVTFFVDAKAPAQGG